jgi:hypothetical protein
MVRPERFELPTCCSGGNRSIQLSYGRAHSEYYEGMVRMAARRASAMAAICAGPVRQHPPTACAPAANQSRARMPKRDESASPCQVRVDAFQTSPELG